MTADELRSQATKKRIDWNEGRHLWTDWREFVGPSVRGIWHTLDDEQKVAIATDAYEFATVDSERFEPNG